MTVSSENSESPHSGTVTTGNGFSITDLPGSMCIVASPTRPLSWYNRDELTTNPYFITPKVMHIVLTGKNMNLVLHSQVRLFLTLTTHDTVLDVGMCTVENDVAVLGKRSGIRLVLHERLDRLTWVMCGGYAGWLVVLGKSEYEANNAQEVLNILVAHCTSDHDLSELVITRYESDELAVYRSDSGEYAIVYTHSDRSLDVYNTPSNDERPLSLLDVYNSLLYIMPVPAEAVVSRDHALQTVMKCLTNALSDDKLSSYW